MTLGCAATLTACGGGGGSSESSAAPVAPKSVSIDAYGDSTMASYITKPGGSVVADPTVTQMTQTGLQNALGSGYRITIANHGVSGATLCELISGTGKFASPLAEALKTSSSTYVLENFGLNDSNPVVTPGGTVAQYQQCVEQFVDTVRAAGKTPILEEPNPVGNPPASWGFDNTTLAIYVAALNAVALQKSVTVISQYQYFQSLSGWQSLLSDGVHPVPDGYYMKALREVAVLMPILGR